MQLKISLQDGANNEAGGAGAMATVLDDAGDCDLGMVTGSKGDEPAVVGMLRRLRGLLDRYTLCFLDDLRRAGFRGDRYPVDSDGMSRAVWCGNHVGHRLADGLKHRRVDTDAALDNRRIILHDRTVERARFSYELGFVAYSAAGPLGGKLGELKQRDSQIALTDSNGERLGRIPSLVEALLLPFGGGNTSRFFVAEIDIGLLAEAKRVRPLREPVDPEVFTHLVEKHVAGLDNRALNRGMAVTLLQPTPVLRVANVTATESSR